MKNFHSSKDTINRVKRDKIFTIIFDTEYIKNSYNSSTKKTDNPKDLKYSSEEDTELAKKHMKRCLT